MSEPNELQNSAGERSPTRQPTPSALFKRATLAALSLATGSAIGWLLYHAPPTFVWATSDPEEHLFKVLNYGAAGLVTLFFALRGGLWFVVAWFIGVWLFFHNQLLPAAGLASFTAGMVGAVLALCLRPRAPDAPP